MTPTAQSLDGPQCLVARPLAYAYLRMPCDLRRARARYVIVPSLWHIAHNRILQNVRLSRLEFDTGAEVLELNEV